MVVALGLVGLVGPACDIDARGDGTIAGGTRPERVVLVTIDTLRADRVGFMGDTRAVTPQLDRLAERGVVFETTLSPAPLTLPSHTTLLTGLDPPAHGVHHNGLFELAPTIPTLAEQARAAGLRTGAFVGAVVLDRRYGLARGFETYDDAIGEARTEGGYAERSADVVVDRALDWIGTTEGRFLAWIHLYDPHLPWAAPAPYARAIADPYRAEIAFADAQVGRLVDAVESRWPDGRTLWVVVSDHGESLGEHGERSHAYGIYEATQRVPLVIAGPGAPTGRRVRRLARLADVAPTVLARLANDAGTVFAGRDLLARPVDDHGDRLAYAETRATEYDHGWSSLYSVRDERFHYIRGVEPELYDVVRDPRELDDLAAESSDRVRAMDAALDRLLSTTGPTASDRDPTPQERAQLAALGYLPDPEARVRPLGAVGGRAPRDGLLEVDRMLRGRRLLAIGRPGVAKEVLCSTSTGSPLVRLACAQAALATGDLAAAEASARALLAARPEAEALLVEVLLSRGALDEAGARLAALATARPESGAVAVLQGRLAEARGDREAALDAYRRAATLRRPAEEGRVRAAVLLLREGRGAEAVAMLEAIERPEELHPAVAASLVEALAADGDAERARSWLTDALRLHPDAEALERLLASNAGLATPELEVARGRRLLELGKPDAAYRVLTSVRFDHPWVDLDRAWAALRSGRMEQARALAERVGEGDWKDVTLAEIAIRSGAWARAEERVRSLQARGVRYAELETMLGRIAEGRGERDRAREIYRSAADGERPGREALWRLAALEIEAGRRDAAEAALSRFGRVDPYANARLVEAELTAGSIQSARWRLAGALTRHPDAEALVALEARIEAVARRGR
jgi:arylsulfatase A-like enzyme/tetratricopeptide (TPR) repeat protein